MKRQWLLPLAFVLLAGGGTYLWYRGRAPALPAIDLTGVDRAVAQAIQEAREAAQRSPRSDTAQGKLGMVLLAHGMKAEAIPCFARAELLAPGEPRWPYLRGRTLAESDPDTAIECAGRAAALCPRGPPEVSLFLAELCAERGRLDEAEGHFRQVLEQSPGNARAELGLGRLACERGQFDDALAHLRRASSAGSSVARASYLLMAEIHSRRGNLPEAKRARTWGERLPSPPPAPDPFMEEVSALVVGREALLVRLQQMQAGGRIEEARALAARIEKAHPALWWLVEGRVRLQRGDAVEAEQALRKAIELDPSSAEARLDLAQALRNQKNEEAAAKELSELLQREPGHGAARLALARCRKAQGRRAEAIADLRELLQRMPESAPARLELGEMLADEGKVDEARVHLRHAVRLDPDDGRARKLLERLAVPSTK